MSLQTRIESLVIRIAQEFNTLNGNQDNRRRKALLLAHLVLLSPEYNTQR